MPAKPTPLCGGCKISLRRLRYGRFRCPGCAQVYGHLTDREARELVGIARLAEVRRLMEQTPRTSLP
jgi:predicted RNA-binding Zn-ribbon protein involved in translation (DUF1610 family)